MTVNYKVSLQDVISGRDLVYLFRSDLTDAELEFQIFVKMNGPVCKSQQIVLVDLSTGKNIREVSLNNVC